MNKIFLLLLAIFINTNCFGQLAFNDSLNIEEFNFFYKDSLEGKENFGNYEPTGIVCLNDGSLIISTTFSFRFPEQSSESHISSGSLIKLNDKLEKQWEIKFKDKRIEKIKKLSDETIIVIGERIDMKKFWMARVDKNGKGIWEKEYNFKYKLGIENFEVDSSDNLFALISSERIYPVKVFKNNGKLYWRFFRISESENNQYLLKISPGGKIKWTTAIDNRKDFSKFGYELIIDKNLFVKTSFEGFTKKGEREKCEMIAEINKSGKIINSSKIENKVLLFFQKYNLISCTSASNDTLILYVNSIAQDTIIFPKEVKHFWIRKGIKTKTNNYLLGTRDHNFGYLVVELTNENKFTGFRMDNRKESGDAVDIVQRPDKSLILIGKGNKKSFGPKNELVTCINLIRIKKNTN